MAARRLMRRVHVWLGWLVGVPLLFWTLSGLWMAARPIDEVRGTALRRPAASIVLPPVVTPPAGPRAIKTLAIEMQGRPVWLVTYADGGIARADAATGRILRGPDAREARAIARAAFAGSAAIATVTRTPANAAPLDLRRARPAWGIAFADGTHVYIDADSGAVLALRTGQWRWHDWMWGLHIMDLQTREETSHAILIASAAIALIATLLGLVLLPLSSRRKRRVS